MPGASSHPSDLALLEATMGSAIAIAEQFRGQTAPNPCVGAAALDEDGALLGISAHQKSGEGHAEVLLLRELESKGVLDKMDTLLVTLEPCNHHGKTPPCAEAVERIHPRRVVIGTLDPNPMAEGGASRLRAAGIEVIEGICEPLCKDLIAPFIKRIHDGLPWVTVKTAHFNGSMVPPPGQKTFTRPKSLDLAHQLRKRAGGLITGSGTVLADDPQFTVRRVADFENLGRYLVVLDRRKRTPPAWIEQRQQDGFEVSIHDGTLEEALRSMAKNGIYDVLIEAGPKLTQSILQTHFWDEHCRITSFEDRDEVKWVRRVP